MRPPSHQPRPHLPTPDPSPPSVTRQESMRPPASSDRTPIRHSCAPLRHSCAGRNPCDHHPINHARTFRPPPRSVIPAPPPSFLRPPPSFLRRQESMRPPSHQPRPHLPTATPIRHSRTPIRPSCAPLRHSCAGRNPCDHHRINHARTFRRPSDPSIGALPPRCSGTPPPLPKRHTPSHLTTPQPLGLMPPTE